MTQNTATAKAALNRKQLAARLGVHVETIKRWERARRLTPRHFGPRTIRYTAEYVEALERDGVPDPSSVTNRKPRTQS